MSVEDIASQSSVIFKHDWEDPIPEFIFPKVVQRHYGFMISQERLENKSTFDDILTQQHLCKKY